MAAYIQRDWPLDFVFRAVIIGYFNSGASTDANKKLLLTSHQEHILRHII